MVLVSFFTKAFDQLQKTGFFAKHGWSDAKFNFVNSIEIARMYDITYNKELNDCGKKPNFICTLKHILEKSNRYAADFLYTEGSAIGADSDHTVKMIIDHKTDVKNLSYWFTCINCYNQELIRSLVNKIKFCLLEVDIINNSRVVQKMTFFGLLRTKDKKASDNKNEYSIKYILCLKNKADEGLYIPVFFKGDVKYLKILTNQPDIEKLIDQTNVVTRLDSLFEILPVELEELSFLNTKNKISSFYIENKLYFDSAFVLFKSIELMETKVRKLPDKVFGKSSPGVKPTKVNLRIDLNPKSIKMTSFFTKIKRFNLFNFINDRSITTAMLLGFTIFIINEMSMAWELRQDRSVSNKF